PCLKQSVNIAPNDRQGYEQKHPKNGGFFEVLPDCPEVRRHIAAAALPHPASGHLVQSRRGSPGRYDQNYAQSPQDGNQQPIQRKRQPAAGRGIGGKQARHALLSSSFSSLLWSHLSQIRFICRSTACMAAGASLRQMASTMSR